MLEEKIQNKAMSYIPEGLFCTRSPLFNGKNYYFSKGKMELFLKSQDINMWKVVTECNFVPQTTDAATTIVTIKPEASWIDEGIMMFIATSYCTIPYPFERATLPCKRATFFFQWQPRLEPSYCATLPCKRATIFPELQHPNFESIFSRDHGKLKWLMNFDELFEKTKFDSW